MLKSTLMFTIVYRIDYKYIIQGITQWICPNLYTQQGIEVDR